MLRGNYKVKSIIEKGYRRNRLTAIKFSHKVGTHQYWFFRCDCGNEKVIKVGNVKSGGTKSCGCLGVGKKIKHGMAGTKIYNIWKSMRQRCFNKNHKQYKDWGGRGIMICKEWLKFENFYRDMGNRPEGKSLDRINNDGNYCKENCRWATRKEQCNNRRSNHLITYNGKTQNISQWAGDLNIKRRIVFSRIMTYHWSVERALKE